jgi:hypothetical protein
MIVSGQMKRNKYYAQGHSNLVTDALLFVQKSFSVSFMVLATNNLTDVMFHFVLTRLWGHAVA